MSTAPDDAALREDLASILATGRRINPSSLWDDEAVRLAARRCRRPRVDPAMTTTDDHDDQQEA